MSAPPPPARPVRALWPIAVVAAVAGIYAVGHLDWFLNTPLGRVPVLDARESLQFGNAIADGTLPPEPFYRAPGYALMVALLRFISVPPRGLFAALLSLGAVFHLINAALIASIARAWFGNRAALISGLLFALDPIFVHFAVQAMDATPALTCFLAGLLCLAPDLAAGDAEVRRPRRWAAASLAWAAATVLRPNYLLPWVVLPVLAIISVGRTRAAAIARPTARKPQLFFAACVGALIFAAIAVWQYRIAGAAGFLPAQGPYNLWAANEPGANGRFYVQRYSLPPAVAEQNPARAESLLRFTAETGHPPASLAEANRYWRKRFITYVVHDPLGWSRLLARKLYALLNNWEQYNNETPAFHIARSPWLRWSPIGWGAILVVALVGVGRIAKDFPVLLLPFSLIAVAVAGSALLFYVSARFRLPLAALATLPAGAALAAPGFWRSWARRRQLALASAAICGALVAFSAFDGVNDRSTFVQDHVLLARAAETVGDDQLAYREAEAALALRPDHPDALRLAVASYFNLILEGDALRSDETRWREASARLLANGATDTPDLAAVAAFAIWRSGRTAEAMAQWRRLGSRPPALAARLLVGDSTVDPNAFAAATQRDGGSANPLVQLAMAQRNSARASQAAAENVRLRQAADRLLNADVGAHSSTN